MLLDSILRHNQAFLDGRPGSFRASAPIALLTCVDGRINPHLGPALGLDSESVIIVRNAGNVVLHPQADPLRSLAMAVYLKGAREIVVLGHSDCRMAQFEAAGFLSALEEWGVVRQHLGPINLRQWAGAFHNPRHNVRRSVDLIGQCPFLPAGVPVHGLFVDITNGSVEVLADGYELQSGRALGKIPVLPVPFEQAVEEPESAPVPAESGASGAPSGASAAAPARKGESTGPVVITPPLPKAEATRTSAEPPPRDLTGSLRVLRQVLREIRQHKHYRVEVDKMMTRLAAEKDPARSLAIVEETISKVARDRPEATAALEFLLQHTAAGPGGSGYVQNLLRQLLKG